MALELDPTVIAALKILGFEGGARNDHVELLIGPDHDESKLWLSITYENCGPQNRNSGICRGTTLLFQVNRWELLEAAVLEVSDRSEWRAAKSIPDKWPEKKAAT